MTEEWKEAMRLLCLAGDDSLMSKRLENVPDADEFFRTLKMYMGNAPSDWTGLCTTEYTYHQVDGVGFLAWGRLYIAIPEYDTYKRYEGKYARVETLVEVVQSCQHFCWKDEDSREELQRDINEYIRTS